MRKLPPLLVAILLLVLSTPTATAQDPITSTLHLPFIKRDPLYPYNLPAESLVLQPVDMPAGYELDEDESGPVTSTSCGQRAVDAYLVAYSNDDLLFSGTPVVENVAAVFRSPPEASNYIACYRGYATNHPDFSRFISVPTMGNESLACEFMFGGGPYGIVGYSIVIRRGNLITHVATGGFLFASDFDDAMMFAKSALNRVNNQIACCNK